MRRPVLSALAFLLSSLLASLLLPGCGSASPPPTSPPNVLIILIDDAGYADFGFMGSEDLPTPQIDALARSGVIFTDAHTSASVCAPSRAGLITGRYQQRFGFECNGPLQGLGLATSEQTLGQVFTDLGYQTIALGKWHLGDQAVYHPNERGFQEFYGFIGGGRSYFPLENPNPAQLLQHNSQAVAWEGYLTDELGEQAVRYIEAYQQQPWLMYLAFNAVHTPMEAKAEDLARFEGHPRQELAAMTWSLDENVGKVMQALKETGQEENTLVFFASDNGGAHNNQSSMGPLKGWKGNKFEGGHRVPFVVAWPGTLPAGETYPGLISTLDIFATSLGAAQASVDDLDLDGTDLIPYLTGKISSEPHEALFWRKDEMAAARIGDHKLIRLAGYGSTLYNLETNLGETEDLSQRDTARTARLQQALLQWESGMKEPLWLEGEAWTQVTYHIHQRLMENQPVLYKDPGDRKRVMDSLAPLR
jgi:arylsulfatase A-like enzyme